MQKVIMALKVIAGLLNDLVAELEATEQPAQPETKQQIPETEQPKAETDASQSATPTA
jgi:hypothetical protein